MLYTLTIPKTNAHHIKIRFVHCQELCIAFANNSGRSLDVVKKCQFTKRVSSEHLPNNLLSKVS